MLLPQAREGGTHKLPLPSPPHKKTQKNIVTFRIIKSTLTDQIYFVEPSKGEGLPWSLWP